ncbi:unnamed protein product [Oncorhynchus mykiss]|uniref:TLC domain-containing protein n=1 Tax=Oncorhynchus mykiss TaxID=8022 RepID=A0A060VWM7_ONCMY|nr:unnamed protein product [Oncorhynchus mykiss]
MTSLAVGVVLCLTGWITLYTLLCNTNGSHGSEWNCRLVTLLHGILAVCITAYIGYVDGPWPFTHPGTKNTPLQISAMVISLGYFFFDMGWCVYFRTEGPVMLAHHTMSILGILLTLSLGESGIESCAVLFGREVVDVLFVVLFVFMRIVVGGRMLYCELISPRPRLIIKCGGVAMYVLSWVFMVDIGRFAYRKSQSKYRRWRDQHKLAAVNGHVGKAD